MNWAEALPALRAQLDGVAVDMVDKVDSTNSELLRRALQTGVLTWEDLEGTEPALIEKLLVQVPAKLTLSDQDAPCEGGFLLRGGSYEKDCSLNALMAELRLKEETNAARILFS